MVAVLTDFSLVPELQHWFNRFVIGSQMNKEIVSPPVDLNILYLPNNSFIEMLFNDDYSKTDYGYKYRYATVSETPRAALRRLQIYPASWKYLLMDSTGDNIFGLQAEDLTMLNAMLAYRKGATSTTQFQFVDSTSTMLVDSTGTYTLYTSYNSLTSELSKLIYLYLRLKVLDDFSLYNNTTIVSSGGLLETCFEAYLLETFFDFMTSRNPDLQYNCTCE